MGFEIAGLRSAKIISLNGCMNVQYFNSKEFSLSEQWHIARKTLSRAVDSIFWA